MVIRISQQTRGQLGLVNTLVVVNLSHASSILYVNNILHNKTKYVFLVVLWSYTCNHTHSIHIPLSMALFSFPYACVGHSLF